MAAWLHLSLGEPALSAPIQAAHLRFGAPPRARTSTSIVAPGLTPSWSNELVERPSSGMELCERRREPGETPRVLDRAPRSSEGVVASVRGESALARVMLLIRASQEAAVEGAYRLERCARLYE